MPARPVSTATVAPSACRGHDAVRQRIGGHDHVHARAPKQLDEQETERAAAVDARRLPGRTSAEVERVQRDAERLEQGRLDVGERVGQAIGEAFRPRQSRAQRTVGRVARRTGRRCRGSRGRRRTARSWPHAIAGSRATRSPVRAPVSMTPTNSWPRTSGRVRTTSPMAPSSNQCRSEPHRPTAVTRTRTSSSPGVGTGSSWQPQVALVVEAQRDHRGCP